MTNERKLAPCGKAIAADAKYFSCAMLPSTPVGVAHNLVITRLQGCIITDVHFGEAEMQLR